MAAKLSGAMGGVLLYLTEIFYLDARIARIGEIKNHELQDVYKRQGNEVTLVCVTS